jgi:hypothetical protein
MLDFSVQNLAVDPLLVVRKAVYIFLGSVLHDRCKVYVPSLRCRSSVRRIADILLSVYSNSLLATLNSRSRVRAALDEPISVNLPPISPSSNTGRKDRLASNCAEARLGSLCFAERGDGGVVDSELSVRKSQDFHTRCHDADFELNVEGASVR